MYAMLYKKKIVAYFNRFFKQNFSWEEQEQHSQYMKNILV